MGSTSVTSKGLQHLMPFRDLEFLEIQRCPLGDEGLQVLKLLKNLKVLWLYGTRVTQEAVESLQKDLPGCDIDVD